MEERREKKEHATIIIDEGNKEKIEEHVKEKKESNEERLDKKQEGKYNKWRTERMGKRDENERRKEEWSQAMVE